jgi:carbamoyltransferase
MILGINSAYHESAAALIDREGRIVAAAEEERFSGRKHGKAPRPDHAHHLPLDAIAYCLREAGVTWRDLAAVAYSFHPELRLGLAYAGVQGDPGMFGYRVNEAVFQESLARVPRLIARETAAPFFFVPHHAAHAWYAVGTSPLERASVLVADGIGERTTLSIGRATRGELELEEVARFPDSVGLLWEKVSRFMGLTTYDAGKVMALAGALGDLKPIPLRHLLAFRGDRLWVDQDVLHVEYQHDFSGLHDLVGSRRERPLAAPEHRRLAAGLQDATEQVLVAAAARLVERYREQGLVFGGGVALNCRANGVLAASGVVDHLHAGPASHDAGTALGAAWHVHTVYTGLPVPHQDPALIMFSGPALEEDGAALHRAGWQEGPSDDSLDGIVDALLQGAPVGWLDGRLEFGPRALGARSILASPAHQDVVARVNQLKGRHPFEPLAVVVPEEDAAAVFAIPPPARGLATLMLTTVSPTAAWRGALAHVLHQDGSARAQVVRPALTPRLHALVRRFAARSGLPLLINTSYNPRGEPMPATLAQALPMAERLGLSHLAINGRLWTHGP